MKNTFEEQLSAVINDYFAVRGDGYDNIYNQFTHRDVVELQTRCIAAIERATGSKSTYYKQVTENAFKDIYKNLPRKIGVAKALLYDIQNGYLQNVEEIIHSDLFSDFLEMASHLVSQGYKDPAAVMTGSTLEVHLRKLCEKNGIDTLKKDDKPKKADSLNAELAKAGVYTKSDLKNVTAWLDLRNNAAHGHYDKYNEGQARLLIDGVRDFITRHPA